LEEEGVDVSRLFVLLLLLRAEAVAGVMVNSEQDGLAARKKIL